MLIIKFASDAKEIIYISCRRKKFGVAIAYMILGLI